MRTRGFEVVKHKEDKIITLPSRSTKNSAGYDFFAYQNFCVPSMWKMFIEGENIKPYMIPTGIKAYMRDDEVLELYSRSSSPSKLGLIMSNSVGIIDSDYYENPDNDGEISFMFYNIFPFDAVIRAGDKIGQGIFKNFLKADGDNASRERVGGIGSTGK